MDANNTEQTTQTQINTNGGAAIDGSLDNRNGCFIGRDVIFYFFAPETIGWAGAWLRDFFQRTWRFWFPFLLLEGVITLLFFRYQAQYLLSQTIYLLLAVLIGSACWCWHYALDRRRLQPARWPLIAATSLSLLAVGGLGQQARAALNPPQLPTEQFGIAVATFGEGPDFRVTRRSREITDLLYADLQQGIQTTPAIQEQVVLRRLGVVHSSLEGEQRGQQIAADLVIWGQILTTGDEVVVNFKILQTPGFFDNPAFPQVLPLTPRKIEGSIDISSGESLKVRTITAQQSLAITAFSLGLYFQSLPDYRTAAHQFKIALDTLEQLHEPTDVTDLGLILFYLARSYVQLGQYDQAMLLLEQAERFRPDDSALFIIKAYIHRVRGEDALQRATLEQVLAIGRESQLGDKTIPALFNRGLAYETLEEYEAALREYRAIHMLDPNFFSAYLSTGRVLTRLKRFAEAQAAYTTAASLTAGDPARRIWLRLNEGYLAQAQGDFATARQAFQEIIALNPRLATAHHQLARTYEAERSWDSAWLAYQQLTKVSPDRGWSYTVFGDFLARMGDHNGAVEAYTEALRHYLYADVEALVYAHLGQSYAELGDAQAANRAFTAALARAKTNAAHIHALYGYTLQKFAQHQAAIEQYEAVLALTPEALEFSVRMNLAQLYESTQRLAQARQIYEFLLARQNELSLDQQHSLAERWAKLQARTTFTRPEMLPPGAL